MSKIELLCVDVDGTMTNGNLIYGFMSHFFNSPLELHSADYTDSSLRGRIADSHEAIQKSKIDCHDSADAESRNDESNKNSDLRGSIFRRFCGFSSAKQGNKTDSSIDEAEREESRKSVKKTNAQFAEIAKVFNVKDGLALAYWAKTLNRKVAIITGRSSEILRARAKELGIDELLFMGIRDKGAKVRELKERFALDSSQIATIGDDLNDIPMFKESHFNFAPSDCAEAMKALPHTTILNAKGGCGAVREAIEIILKKESLYDEFVSQFI